MDFSNDELIWINNALNEVLTGDIEEWEFQTRIGGSSDDVRILLRRVNDQLNDVRRTDAGQ